MTRTEYADLAARANAGGKILVPDGNGSYRLETPPLPQLTVEDYEREVDRYLLRTANEKGYDNAYTCLSYLNSTNQKWKHEAEVFNSFRDSVWVKCHEILDGVTEGRINQPTISEVIAALPVIEW